MSVRSVEKFCDLVANQARSSKDESDNKMPGEKITLYVDVVSPFAYMGYYFLRVRPCATLEYRMLCPASLPAPQNNIRFHGRLASADDHD